MKTETYTCDVCGHVVAERNCYEATLSVGSTGKVHHHFHVCSTCWVQTPKGVFQKAYNALMRLMGLQ